MDHTDEPNTLLPVHVPVCRCVPCVPAPPGVFNGSIVHCQMFKSSSCPVTQNTLARDYSLLSLRAGALACSNASSAILASCTATPVLSKITSPRGRTRGPSSHAPNSTTASLWIRPEKGCTPAHQWQSVATSSQRRSVAISGTQRHSVAISGNQWKSYQHGSHAAARRAQSTGLASRRRTARRRPRAPYQAPASRARLPRSR